MQPTYKTIVVFILVFPADVLAADYSGETSNQNFAINMYCSSASICTACAILNLDAEEGKAYATLKLERGVETRHEVS